MGKVRYKNISESYKNLAAPSIDSGKRKSLGFEGDVSEFYNLNIEDIIPYKKQARKIFNDKEINQLASTIKEYGVTTPIVVIKSQEGDQYEVISGERRLKAAKIAGINRIPCIIRSAEADSEEIALIENIQRKDLHPVELSMGYKSLLSNEKYGDRSKLAEKIGVSASHISETLKLASLPEEIKDHLLSTGKKSRVVLRKLMKAETLEEMNRIVGLSTSFSSKKQVAILYEDKGNYRLHLKQKTLSKEDRLSIVFELEKNIKILKAEM